MEQLLFLALLGVLGLLRWFSQIAEERRNREAEKRTGEPRPNAPVQRAPAQTEEERIRRFMEALGVPTSHAPIPKAPPKVEPPKPAPPAAPSPRRTSMPVDPFPVPRGGLPLPPVVVARPPLPRQSAPVPPPPLVPPPPSAAPPPPPLPTRETTVFAEPSPRRATREIGGAEFEVRDIAEGAYEGTEALDSGERRGAARASGPSTSRATRLASAESLREAIILREIFGPPRSMQPLDLTRE